MHCYKYSCSTRVLGKKNKLMFNGSASLLHSMTAAMNYCSVIINTSQTCNTTGLQVYQPLIIGVNTTPFWVNGLGHGAHFSRHLVQGGVQNIQDNDIQTPQRERTSTRNLFLTLTTPSNCDFIMSFFVLALKTI